MSNINTLFELLTDHKVEIPILQRDYAQGRKGPHVEAVRKNLLKDMKSAILDTSQLNLGFVYGKANGDKFIPIDGQQRLTTLFLLHVYAFRNDDYGTDRLSKFTYETRSSSRNFLKQLIEKRAVIFEAGTPSKEIEDSAWFVSDWKHDPTIQSALVMLDAIHEEFKDVTDLAQRLSKQEPKPVIFKFLEEKDLAMEDGLYLKLNARGRPISSMEDFKARLIVQLQKLVGNSSDFQTAFEHSFDCEWTDLFWSRYKDSFDSSYLTFWGILLLNNANEKRAFDTHWAASFDCGGIDQKVFETASFVLKFLCNNKGSEAAGMIFAALEGNNQTYQKRVLFHAVTTYMYKAKGIDTGSLGEWLRIIKNLTLNSVIDREGPFENAIVGINELAESYGGLLEHFCQDKAIAGFDKEQIREEKLKARIIKGSQDFAEKIYEAEKHPYFRGQIRSALFFATDENADLPDFEKFKQYWGKISALFSDKEPRHSDHLLRRALLTLGDYSLPVEGRTAYKTLCVNKPEEATSMKRLFSNHGSLVRSLLDKLNLSEEPAQQLKTMIESSAIPKNDWRYCFINHHELFDFMSASYLRICEYDGKLLLIPNKSSGGRNWEIFVATLYLNPKLKPGFRPELGDGRGGDRYLEFKGFKIRFKNKQFVVTDKNEKTVFETKTNDPISEITEYLNQQSVAEQVPPDTRA